jgi:hypothetical protein
MELEIIMLSEKSQTLKEVVLIEDESRMVANTDMDHLGGGEG